MKFWQVILFISLSAIVIGTFDTQEVGAATNITFIVTIPKNTPTTDRIYLEHFRRGRTVSHKMVRVASYTYSVPLSTSEFERGQAGKYHYRYVRNDAGFIGAEFVAPDDQYYRGGRLGRSLPLSRVLRGGVVRDRVSRWRWFPPGNTRIQGWSSLAPAGEFQPRINNVPFRSGMGIIDLYRPEFDLGLNHTAKRLKDKGFNWITVYPPWQWVKQDPTPKVGNALELGNPNVPNYPNDAKLIEHLRAFKRAGLKLLLAPQLCCLEINTKSRSQEWWSAYVSEVERFLLHHARIAKKVKADAFLFDLFGAKDAPLSDIDARIKTMLQKVKQIYHGPLGTIVWTLGDSPDSANIVPEASYYTWGSGIDFFLLHSTATLSQAEALTDDELAIGAGKALDAAKALYETYGKPLVVDLEYYAIKQAWKGGAFAQTGKIPADVDNEKSWKLHSYSGRDQARVVHAYFNAIKSRPWIIGLQHLGYDFWELPLHGGWSLRGKPAEDIWQKWNRMIFGG